MMSHLTWQTGTFTSSFNWKIHSVCSLKNESGLSGGTAVCEDGMLYSTSLYLLTSMSDCLRCSFLSRDDDRSKRTILLKWVKKMWSISFILLSKEQKSEGYSFFHQVSSWTPCFMMCSEGTCHQWTSTMSTSLGNQEKWLILSSTAIHFSCPPKGMETASTDSIFNISTKRYIYLKSTWKSPRVQGDEMYA